MGIIDLVRGMRDVLPDDFMAQTMIAAQLEQVLTSYGYLPIELPIIEQRDLYLRKLGEELVGKIYEFTFNGRELALRPEWTASVLRAYVARLQDQPLPLRLRYSGPVFRNERPQRATYRQFTQIGVEIIGGPAPRADAECIALACAGLDAVGIRSYRVRIGHIGLIRTLLAALGLSERTQSFLAWSLERMRHHGVGSVRAQLETLRGELPLNAAQLDDLNDEQAEALLLHSLRAIGVNLRFGTRPPEAIVGRLVRKLRRVDEHQQVEHALTLLERLSIIQGTAAAALPEAEALLSEFGLPTNGLAELRTIFALAMAHGVPEERLVLDFGLGRGLHYYTGTIFEIYADDDLQLCGGGRYDELVSALGGSQSVPAIGFAYGLERVVMAAASQAPGHTGSNVLVVATDEETYPYALQVAHALRTQGYTTLVDVRNRSLASNLRDASRRDVDYVAIVGAGERARGELLWRDVHSREERRIAFTALPEKR